jgi:hypothetical protein
MPALPDSLTLRDGALELRQLEPSDRDAVLRACQDPELLRSTALPDPYTAEGADRLVDEVRASGRGGVELAIAVDGDLVGSTHPSSTATGVPAPPTGLRPRRAVTATRRDRSAC